MMTQWDVLKHYVMQNNVEGVLRWLYDFDSDVNRQFEGMSDYEYLKSESKIPWFNDVVKDIERRAKIEEFMNIPEEELRKNIEDLVKYMGEGVS